VTIWDRVDTALSGLNVPMAANTYIVESDHDLPDVFLTYLLISSPPAQHADNVEVLRDYTVQVSIWSRDGLVDVPDVVGAMIAAGFTHGNDRELPFSTGSQHFGLALEFNFTEER
jgi:hypothetical protein